MIEALRIEPVHSGISFFDSKSVEALVREGRWGHVNPADIEELAAKLDEAAQWFVSTYRFNEGVPGGFAKWTRKIEKCADDLLTLCGADDLGVAEDDTFRKFFAVDSDAQPAGELALLRSKMGLEPIPPGFDPCVDDGKAFERALVSVAYLKGFAKLTSERWEARKGGHRHAPGHEMILVWHIGKAFEKTFGIKWTYTTNPITNERGGAFIDFFRAVTRHMLPRFGQEIAKQDCQMIAELKALADTPSRVAKRINEAKRFDKKVAAARKRSLAVSDQN